jgi:kynureninase
VYLCGHSLGLQPKTAAQYVEQELEDWRRLGVLGHHNAGRPWIEYHEHAAAPLAALVGAHESEVVAMNSLTVNLHLMMVSFFRPMPAAIGFSWKNRPSPRIGMRWSRS